MGSQGVKTGLSDFHFHLSGINLRVKRKLFPIDLENFAQKFGFVLGFISAPEIGKNTRILMSTYNWLHLHHLLDRIYTDTAAS